MIKYSDFLEDILSQARQIQKDAEMQYLCAPCIIVAVVRFCADDYRGYSKYDDCYYLEEYGEEKLRYLYKKVFKAGPRLIEFVWKRRLENDLAQYDTDFMSDYEQIFEELSHSRRPAYVSADMVFLAAVKSIAERNRIGVREEFQVDFSIAEVLKQTDKDIYDYVVCEIEKVVQKLQNKSDKAKAIRDWRPAKKFLEPEELKSLILGSVKVIESEKELSLTLPYFFNDDDGELKLTICKSGNLYYAHDNGCALYQLRRCVRDEEKVQRILKRLFKREMLQGELLIRHFHDANYFLLYIELLILVAHAELYYTKLDSYGMHYDYEKCLPEEKEKLDVQELKGILKQCVRCGYDENRGLLLRIFHRYARSSETPAFLLETMEDGTIKISDGKAGKYAGEIFEMLRFRDDDISPYSKQIKKVCKKFGVDFDGQYISLMTKNNGKDAFIKAFVCFLNAAVLLSEFNCMIELPYLNGDK